MRMLGMDIKRLTLRHYLGRIFANFAAWTLKIPIYDTQCGAKAFRRCAALELALRDPFLSRWAFDVELLGRLLLGGDNVSGLREEDFVEVPLRRWHDIPGFHWRFHDLLRMGFDLLSIRRNLSLRHRKRSE